jgi:hypothetical protein
MKTVELVEPRRREAGVRSSDDRAEVLFPDGQLAAGAQPCAAVDQFTEEWRRPSRKSGASAARTRVAFTYQNLDGQGWSALAKAMATGGIRPIVAFPVLGGLSEDHERRGGGPR